MVKDSDHVGADACNNQSPEISKRVLFEREQDASEAHMKTKTIVLLRHGQSRGQIATVAARRNDESLTDCKLSPNGEKQARNISEAVAACGIQTVDLIVSSPLTRALQTALLGFQNTPILIAYDLREVGSMIPENIPRPITKVLDDLVGEDEQLKSRIDFDTLRPEKWPKRHDTPPKVVRKDRIRDFFRWLATSRDEQTIVVVCHYHVIRSALSPPFAPSTLVRPENCVPIVCSLDEEGTLVEQCCPNNVITTATTTLNRS